MDITQVTLLALIQGLTEFLPISSSGHLILAPHLFGYADQGLAFDVAVHLGSLFAVMLYFRRDVITIGLGWIQALPNKTPTQESRLGWLVIIGTLPAVIFGLALKDLIETDLRSPIVIAFATIGFGVLLLFADWRAKRVREITTLTWKDGLMIGLMQALALIPGTSRSGITMTAGLMLGMTREAASRFSFLLAIPLILAASLLKTKDLLESNVPVDWLGLGLGVILSFLAAFAAIHYFLKFVEKVGMLPFVIYRFLLGGVIFWLVL